MDLRQIHREDVFGPSFGRVFMSRSKVEVTRDKKRALHSHHPPGSERMVRSCKESHAAADGTILLLLGCDFGGLRAVYVW